MRIVPVLFIGAGPANLAAANYLLDSGFKDFLLVEKGRALNRRHCPGEKKGGCIFCKSALCHTIEGVGGSSAIYGNKLCYFPASDKILEYFDRHLVSESQKYLDSLLVPFYQSVLNNERLGTKEETSKKHYTSDVIPRYQFISMVSKMTERLNGERTLFADMEVSDIRRVHGLFEIECEGGHVISAEQVVIGTGRSGHHLLRSVSQSLGIALDENQQDIGLRIEASSRNFTAQYYYQADPKLKYDFGEYGSGRTFCACNGGSVVPVKYGQSYYAEGAFDDSFREWNNIAIMARSTKPLSQIEVETWCALVNISSRNGLLLGEVKLEQNINQNIPDEVMKLVPEWPTKSHEMIIKRMIHNVTANNDSLIKYKKDAPNIIRVYGPAIDRYWPAPRIGMNCETQEKNLFIIGDAAGISRGFVQAMTSGVAWAMSRLAAKGSKSTKLWSVLE